MKRTLWHLFHPQKILAVSWPWLLPFALAWQLQPSIPQRQHFLTRLNVGDVPYPINGTESSVSSVTTENLGGEWADVMGMSYNPYRSQLLQDEDDWDQFMLSISNKNLEIVDPFWEQIRFEAKRAVRAEPEAGPQIYQGILSQPSLLVALVTVVAHELETELISAVQLKNLFLSLLTPQDEFAIRMDLEAVASRSPSIDGALTALLFHNGFHALIAYRVGHQLWEADRKGLAYYMQSIVSRKYSADIHPACRMGYGIYLRVGSGVVIGETAVVGNDVSILEGVTLGGTGKENGDRHPKVGNGVIIQDGGAVLGNIPVHDGAVVQAKSIVTKPVPPLAIVSGVPAKIMEYRTLTAAAFDDDLQAHLWHKYVKEWKVLMEEMEKEQEKLPEKEKPSSKEKSGD